MDITQLILDEHAQQRNLFAQIEQIDPKDTAALSSLWKRLRALLDSHAEAEEHFFYPRLMKVGKGGNDADSAAEETEDAIEDHNEIRDTAAAVDKQKVGSKAWFKALGDCNKANGDHMAEEERQGLTDFRQQASLQERHDLGVKFATFEADHLTGVKPVDKDPKKWVKDHAPR
ncbi:hemerythrin domain-containing protein [Sphingomonas bacterium]|uniref:hemerythrin domain-containing protein n=1 Tax=Sphingomonas bacterium TaxID=1895847 RepID=UPI002633F1D0|nr:hemerythrin domain-containing protein [Sphingomonas bacterium]MDB5677134.1 cation-binding protein [Sphingomonas bacterium]